MRGLLSFLALASLGAFEPSAFAQSPTPAASDTVRVNVTINPDESRTVYEFDTANRRATGTTTERDGKPRGKIEYKLDDAGRFESGRVFGPDGRFRFKTLYKYDANGRMQEETQRQEDNALLARIVYSYDAAGKPAGFSIFDASGKMVGGTAPQKPTSSEKPRKPGR